MPVKSKLASKVTKNSNTTKVSSTKSTNKSVNKKLTENKLGKPISHKQVVKPVYKLTLEQEYNKKLNDRINKYYDEYLNKFNAVKGIGSVIRDEYYNPIGYMCAVNQGTFDNPKIKVGWSSVLPNDIYNTKIGKFLALERIYKKSTIKEIIPKVIKLFYNMIFKIKIYKVFYVSKLNKINEDQDREVNKVLAEYSEVLRNIKNKYIKSSQDTFNIIKNTLNTLLE